MINPDTVDKIMDATRVEEVVGEFVMLRKRGVNLLGLCPFHDEKTPSFNVSPTKGIYKCFGCGKGGNAVNFLMEHEHYTYPEALKYLAAKYSIEVEEEKPSPEQQQAMDEKESLFNLSGYAQKYFEKTLHESQEGIAVGLSYLKERDLSLETIKKFGLGYCTNQWDAFTQQALKDGYKKEYLLKTSLAKEKDHQLYDTMRGRVIFPIHNLSGRVLGFGARIMTSDKKRPKYINSAESDIYHKGKVLYGLYFAMVLVDEPPGLVNDVRPFV
ncbi:MAG: CHC2 zinc finger domain-containing protein [Bacteroidales bacterium]